MKERRLVVGSQDSPHPRRPPGWIREALATVLVSVSAPLLLTTLVAAVAWVVPHFIPAPWGYEAKGKFTSLPPDDHELEQWLQEQPGVAWSSVHVYRLPTGVLVSFNIVRPEWGFPLLPDVKAACARLGYRGHVGKLKDRPLWP